jgi:TPR repeat protein
MMARVVLALFFIFFVGASARAETNAFQDAGKRLALVIGISDYEHAQPLRNPVNDARLIAKSLEDLRFEVIFVENAGRAQLTSAHADFVSRLDGTDIAVLYYAGHAIQIDSANYLVPGDAALRSVESVSSELVDLARIVNEMDSRAKTKIVILDACRDNPFERQLAEVLAHAGGERKLGRGLAAIREPTRLEKPEGEGFNTYGSIVAFAAAPGATATDGDGDNSPYTKALAAELARPGVEVGQMFRVAAATVLAETGGKQRPEYLVRLTDEVFFSRPQPSDCDYFAIAPYNQVGIPGVEFDKIRPASAISACEAALAAEPDHPRFLHNLGRAYDAASDYDRAVAFYRKSANLDYVPAFSTLGVMHINGQGTRQDFVEGVRLLKHAASLGYRLAKVGLRNQDFSAIFEQDQFKALQSALKERGHYKGPVDGNFGSGSKAALEAFQAAEGLSSGGATLETLDRLSLLGVIPNYKLN